MYLALWPDRLSTWRSVCGHRGTTRNARILAACNYLAGMLKNAFNPFIPTKAAKVPDRPDWLHEVKHDGYRLIIQRESIRVRLWTGNGHEDQCPAK